MPLKHTQLRSAARAIECKRDQPGQNADHFAHWRGAYHLYYLSCTLCSDAIVAAVPHRSYLAMPSHELLFLLNRDGVLVDVKSALDRNDVSGAEFRRGRL
jgi:hypothetical protein